MNNTYEHVVYLSHPYGGKKENLDDIDRILTYLVQAFDNDKYLFVSPLHAFSQHYSLMSYEAGLNECLWLLSKCTEMWVYGDPSVSVGVRMEIQYCIDHNIPYKYMNDKSED